LAGAACAAAVALYAYTFWRPSLLQDDFQILAASRTWPLTRANLWVPNNEHAMPLGRLLTFAVIEAAGRATRFPLAVALVGPVALLVAMPLTYRFVRRELGHPLYGLLAMIIFGVTAVYQQAVFWFAASFSVVALDTLLLGLLAAQSYRRTGRWPFLHLCTVWCVVAPCWFAIGVLAGPLCALYLLSNPWPSGALSRRSARVAVVKRLAEAALPLLGTAAFLAVSLPLTAATIAHLEHYRIQDTDAIQAFQPGKGFLISLRSVVENLLLGLVGVTDVTVPVPLVVVALLALAAFGVWWWRRAPRKRLLLLGVGLIGASYLLVYSARANWADDFSLVGVSWSRYHLLPQLGLALFVVGGLPAWDGRLFLLQPDGSLTKRQVRFVACLIVVLMLINLPRSVTATVRFEPLPFDFRRSRIVPPDAQQATLRRVDEVDARCREYGISADAAKRALPWLSMPGGSPHGAPGEINGWILLAGSATPREPETRSDEEIRRLLDP
jgi:hypothetical protein